MRKNLKRIFFNQLDDYKTELLTKRGVYKIINLSNGNFYIGSTTVDFFSRLKCHLASLRKNKHGCNHLLNAYLKYGEKKFIFCIFKILENDDEIRKQEQKFLKRYIKQKVCYNTSLDVFSFMKDRNHTIVARKKISKALKGRPIDKAVLKRRFGRKNTKKTIKKMQKSALKRDDTKRLKVLRSKKHRELVSKNQKKRMKNKKNRDKIRNTMKKIWKNKKYREKAVKAMQGKKRTKRQRNTYSICKFGKSIAFRKDGKTITVVSLRHFCKKYKLNRVTLRLVIRGVKKIYKGWELVE